MTAHEDNSARHSGPSPSRNLQSRAWNAVLDLHGTLFARLNGMMVRDFGISLAKYDVLAQLQTAPDGMTQGELSRRLKVTGGNVSGLVRRMAAENLIAREAAPTDRRAVIVRLTANGRDTFLAAQAHHDALLGEWLGDVPDASLQEVCQQLAALKACVDKADKVHEK
ncbi:MarR family transcriptional regulator [Aurantiacibacter xanthus]|uniref:MarR family transcriptional regulator n=1 Tax=Aurantiacibacter xanthus TaxID=1784712 RepID=A0A3A1P0Z4_9SPHN|nr:MarR family transcriptional regulator [Aurantiacibacter xanthus]RIV82593.1 MarR family transcriptional regulator [Aurantiacibacter xanthus]